MDIIIRNYKTLLEHESINIGNYNKNIIDNEITTLSGTVYNNYNNAVATQYTYF